MPAVAHEVGLIEVPEAQRELGPALATAAADVPDHAVEAEQPRGELRRKADVEDVDALVARAVAAGATLLRPVTDEFYGDRVAALQDPFGHRWRFSTHIEDVSEQEMQRRLAAMSG